MSVLAFGLVLWVAGHLFKRLLPGLRARLGEVPGKLVATILILAGVVLMVIGFRRAEVVPVYTPLPGIGHLTDLLMLVAVFLYGVGHSKGWLRTHLRHPMLMGTMVWAAAHLLVNGDKASLILFGGIGIWAAAEIALINAQSRWTPPPKGGLRGDAINLAISVVVYAAIAGVHIWLGKNPFLGTYG